MPQAIPGEGDKDMPVKTKRKSVVMIVLIVLVLAAIVGLLIWRGGRAAETPLPTPRPQITPQVVVREKEVEKIVTVEKEITAELLQDGLRDMGKLITEEYYFTEVVDYSSVKKWWKLEVPYTESSYLASYDGVVSAGIDFAEIRVEKDDENKEILVTLPAARIDTVDIDPSSLQVYSEKHGLGNPIAVLDFNDSLIELENTARAKAEERGVLTRADENAARLVRNFIASLVDTGEYTLLFKRSIED